jgi:LacI family transcriptional regulator
MPQTIKDIAKRAGVSIATVSYVVNNSRVVSPEVRGRVEKAINELGYHPDINARSIKTQRTSTIGLIIPDNANPFFAEIAKGVEDAGFEAGYSVILCNSNSMEARELAYINLLLSKRVDGVVFGATSKGVEHARLLVEQSIPTAIFYREVEDLNIDSFRIDNIEAGYKATQHLIDLGHRKIACIQPRSPITPSSGRVLGFRKALLEAGIEVDEELMPVGDNLISGGGDAVMRLLQTKKCFTAIYSTNDAMAIGAMRAARDAGYQIPEDISIVGTDDILLARYSEPPLTTIAQPKQEAGSMAVKLLIERIEKRYKDGPREFILPIELIVRKSTIKLDLEREYRQCIQ